MNTQASLNLHNALFCVWWDVIILHWCPKNNSATMVMLFFSTKFYTTFAFRDIGTCWTIKGRQFWRSFSLLLCNKSDKQIYNTLNTHKEAIFWSNIPLCLLHYYLINLTSLISTISYSKSVIELLTTCLTGWLDTQKNEVNPAFYLFYNKHFISIYYETFGNSQWQFMVINHRKSNWFQYLGIF